MDPFDLNDPEFQKAERLADLMEEYTDSPELLLVTKTRTFKITIRTFEKNYEDLIACITNTQPTTPEDVQRWVLDRDYRQDQQDEISRMLHNFVASASSLIDHSRVFYEEMYVHRNLMPYYQERKNETFKYDGLSRFIVSLRQYCQHYQTPILSTSVYMNNRNGIISSIVAIDRQVLFRFDGWNSQAKAFITAAPEKIDLVKVCSEYHNKVRSFYDWFQSEQAKIHKDAFEYVRRMEQELGEEAP